MKRYIMILLLAGVTCSAQNQSFTLNIHNDDSFTTGVYIPRDLNDCYLELDKMLNPKIKNFLKGELENNNGDEKQSLSHFCGHMGFGMWIRNNWGLWGNSRLSEYFNSLGIIHADNMSSIIIDSYAAKLKNEKYNLDAQINFYKKNRMMNRKPEDYIDQLSNGIVTVVKSEFQFNLDNNRVHLGVNKKTNDFWFYEFDKGWYKPTPQKLKKVMDMFKEYDILEFTPPPKKKIE